MTQSDHVSAWFGSLGRHFANRSAAGRALAAQLFNYVARSHTLVLALPRGGVPVAFEIARALGAPLDLMLVRKLGVPGREELACGALAEGGFRVLNEDVVASLAISPAQIDQIAAREARELARQAHIYRGEHPAPQLHGRTVILVDDGLATGATMRAAIAVTRAQAPAKIIVAAPVATQETIDRLLPLVDAVVITVIPETLGAVGLWYNDFAPVSDDEVRQLLQWNTNLWATERADKSSEPLPGTPSGIPATPE